MRLGVLKSETDLRDGAQQLVGAHVAIGVRVQAAACELVVGCLEVSEEDLVVVVGVQQRPDVAGKLVEPSQPDPLVATGAVRGLVVVAVVGFLVVQLKCRRRK